MTHPQLVPYQIDLEIYHRMIEAGILGEDDPVELIEGQIITMSPKGSKHSACLRKIMTWLPDLVGERVQVQLQDPIQVSSLSEPEPDLALVKFRSDFYLEAHPLPSDVELLVEVADSSLRVDREVKAGIYAAAGISHYWIINLPDKVIELHEQPSDGRYQALRIAKPGEMIVVPSLDIETEVEDWLV